LRSRVRLRRKVPSFNYEVVSPFDPSLSPSPYLLILRVKVYNAGVMVRRVRRLVRVQDNIVSLPPSPPLLSGPGDVLARVRLKREESREVQTVLVSHRATNALCVWGGEGGGKISGGKRQRLKRGTTS
jgi:hypothetical protein